MKRVVITKTGGAEVLKVEDVNLAPLEASEVTIRVAAAGLNYADIMARQGLYRDAPKIPCTVGYEVSGVIESVGAGVEKDWIGKEVVSLTRFWGQSELVNAPLERVFLKPKNFSMQEAAAVPVNYLTAYFLLVNFGNLKKNETILIQNAGGGVGLAALQIARALGAKTIGTASSGKKDRLKQFGLDVFVDYRQDNWEAEVQKATEGMGVDLVIDPLGPESWKKSFKLLRHGGRLGMFGASEGSASGLAGKAKMIKVLLSMPWFHPVSLMENNRAVFGANLGHLWHEGERVRGWMDDIFSLLEKNNFKPHVDKTFKFEDASSAHRYLEERKNFGKVLLLP